MKKALRAELKLIIKDYISLGKELCDRLRRTCREDNLLVAWRRKKISKDGYFDYDEVKVIFSFHGIGCRFESDAFVIDLDFGDGGRCDGFDLWRIKSYISENKKFEKSIFRENDYLEKTFSVLIENGDILCRKTSPSPHLYYLTQDKKEL